LVEHLAEFLEVLDLGAHAVEGLHSGSGKRAALH
jgi:hypothetical protein